MKELEFPFDSEYILKKRKSIKRSLLGELEGKTCISKKIAILGGSTTHDVKEMLELFLLNVGIVPTFYESEYNQFWQDVMFDNPLLVEFAPDLILLMKTAICQIQKTDSFITTIIALRILLPLRLGILVTYLI